MAALAMLVFGTPVHRTGPVDHEHNLQRLLLDLGLTNISFHSNFPLGVAHALGGLGQVNAVVVHVLDRFGLQGSGWFSATSSSANARDLDQAEGHDHSMSRDSPLRPSP